jgi:PadR family transcriptional regulator, regulatory protein AphA
MGSAGPVPARRSSLPVKLTPASYLLLGMLRLGRQSGYAIKKATDLSTRHWWPMSLAKVYPELANLEHAGLIAGRDDPHGARARKTYELTDAGKEALVDWLRATRVVPPQVRDERLLRLFFADAAPLPDQLRLVQRLREDNEAEVARIREEIVPIAGAAEQAGTIFPAAVARLSIDVYTAYATSLGELEALLASAESDDLADD